MEQKINLTDIAYFAGLFDGEGSVQYYQRLGYKTQGPS